MAYSLPDRHGGVLSYFARHRTAANLLLVVLLVFGLTAAPNMRAQFFPDVIIDTVSVSTVWEGAGPEDVDSGIVQVLEPVLLAVDGVEASSAFSREGSARITLDFEPGWDMSRAAEDVQSAIDQVVTLPDEAEDPIVRRGAWRDRVTDVVITGPVGTTQLALFADELVTRLFAAGVTRTSVTGVVSAQTIVEVPSAHLVSYDISMSAIATAIAEEVDSNPAGDVSGANVRVRTGVEKRAPADIAAIVLRSNPDGSNLTVGDVATVRVDGVDRAQSLYVGDDPAMTVRVDRSDAGDAIAIQHLVEDVAEEMEASLPRGVQIELIRTRAEAITGRLNILLDNGLMGLGLVLALLFLFLNARTAFWVAAGIPAAMAAAIAIMYVGGVTLNMVSLFGLIITLGIVVDDAIVVGEHADFRARSLGEAPVVAAENAARAMAMPVFAATLTTVIAFFGLVAVGGRFGDLIRDIPYTVIAVLTASLIECFLILPNHMSHALAHANSQKWYDLPSRLVNRVFDFLRDRGFRVLMRGVISARYVVMAGTILILAFQVSNFIRGDVQWRFFNAPEMGTVTGNFAMVEGATRDDTLTMMREMQRATEELAREYEERHGRNPLDYVLAQVGANAGRGLSGTESKDGDLLGGITIELIDADLRPYSSFAFVGELQDRVRSHPLAETVTFRGGRSGPGGDALDVEFFGASVQTLKAASEDLQTELSQFPEVSALQDTLAYDKEELILDLTPTGQALGFSIDALGRVLRARLGGIEAATYPDGPRSAEIRVELPEGELTADFLERMLIRTPTGDYVPLADLVTVARQTGFSTVRRENGLRVVSVTGDLSEDDPARAEEIMTLLKEDILPRIASEKQVEFRLSGLSEQENEFLSDAMTGLVLCLTGIYLVLAWIFSSWSRPLVVMAIIPFGLVGTIYGHILWDVPLSMFTVVGLLGMTGIIINDSIVLITTIDQYAKDRGLLPSIVDAAADRLRPVLLTTLTTVLGLAPLLYEQSQQAQFLKPTVITLVYGLGFGMLLVLLVVPALVAIQQDFGKRFTALKHGLGHRNRALRVSVRTAMFGAGIWLAATVGHVVLIGDLPAGLAWFAEPLPNVSLERLSFVLFAVGTAVWLLLMHIGTGLFLRWRARVSQN